MTRTVEDAALMLDVIAKPDSRDWHSLPHERIEYAGDLSARLDGVKVAYSPTLGYATVDPEIARPVEAAVETLSDLGAKVERVDPGFDDPAPCFRILWWSGARSLLGNLPSEKKALLDPDLADVVDQAMKLTLDDYLDAVKARGALGSHMRQFMEKYDLLVTPALPIAAFDAGKLAPGHEGTGKWVNWTPFTYPFNLTQQPAASVPCGFTSERLPAGLQIVGRMFDDRAVLAACHAYEQASRWNAQLPRLPESRP
jgi:aspartyl-tRNA(Asn)/glutamyl-tRNA(Gln) amidotransferase subunit A